jgi:hypothetical protein
MTKCISFINLTVESVFIVPASSVTFLVNSERMLFHYHRHKVAVFLPMGLSGNDSMVGSIRIYKLRFPAMIKSLIGNQILL